MSGFAWVTLATNDSYSLGALVLAHSLKQAGTAHQLAVLVTPGVTNVMRKNLNDVFNVVEEVNLFDSKDEANLRLLKRPELGVTFTKLHCWRLTQFEKCVFLDADVLVLLNADELFERDEFSAAPDVGWPDCFNSGVFVYRPSMETYNKLVDFALQKGSFDGGDQGLLNAYFSDWAHKDISKHLPFIYNMCSTACYSYLPAFKYYGGNVKIVHFIGPAKPWLQYFDTESRIVQPSPDLQHLQEVLQKWWDIFCSLIHPKLTPDMARSKQAAENLSHFQSHSYTHQNPVFQDFSISEINTKIGQETDVYNVWDPWEEYEEQMNRENADNDGGTECTTIPEVSTCNDYVSSSCTASSSETARRDISNVNRVNAVQERVPYDGANHSPYVSENNQDIIECRPVVVHEQAFNANVEQPISNRNHQYQETEKYSNNHHTSNTASIVDNKLDKFNEPFKDNHHTESSSVIATTTTPPQNLIQISPSLPHIQSLTESLPNLCETSANNSQDASLLYTKDNDDGADSTSQSGLAGAFAQFTLGVKRTAAQDAFENHLRRQAWEVGNIDYMGRDSFDNIWSKICQTLSVTQLESVKDGAVFSSENQQVPELLQEGSTAVEAAAEAAAAPAPDQPIETPPLLEQVRTEVPESSPAAVGSELTAVPVVPIEPLPQAVPPTDVKIEEVAVVPTNNTQPLSEIAPDERIPKPDVVPDPEPLKEVQQQPIIPEERSAETAVESPVLTETAVKDEEEVPAPQKIADVSETVKEAIAPSEVTTSDSQAPTVPDEPSEAVVPPSEPTPVKEVAPPPPPSQSEPVKEITSPVTEAELSVKELPSPPPQTEPVKEIASSQLVAAEVDKQFVSSETKPTEEVVSSPISVPEPVEGAISPEPEQVKEVLPPKPEPKPEPEPVLEEAIVQTTTASKPEPAPIREVLPPEPVKEAAPPPSTEEAKPKPTKREAKTPKLPDSSKLAKTTPTKVETTSESPKAETPPASPKTEEVPPESPKAEQTISASPKPEDIPEAEPSAEVPKSDTKPKEVRKVKKKVKKVPKPEGDASSSEGASKK